MKKLPFLLAFAFLFLAVSNASAQTKVRVKFAKGSSSTTVKGTVLGFAYKDYMVGAIAGQTIKVKLASRNTFTVFSMFLPNGDNLEGAVEADEFTGELPVSGKYVIRVLMMRAEARRKGSISNYTLKISISDNLKIN